MKLKIPMAGICFGHQLMAQALGGTVRKSEKGWGIGRHVYDVVPGNGVIDGERIAIAASHQDQVIEPPDGGNDDFPFGVYAARGTSLCQRLGDVGAAASRIHPGLCRLCVARMPAAMAPPLHWSPQPRHRWNSRSITPTSAARSRAFWQRRGRRDFGGLVRTRCNRHCERSEAIHRVANKKEWIASLRSQ